MRTQPLLLVLGLLLAGPAAARKRSDPPPPTETTDPSAAPAAATVTATVKKGMEPSTAETEAAFAACVGAFSKGVTPPPSVAESLAACCPKTPTATACRSTVMYKIHSRVAEPVLFQVRATLRNVYWPSLETPMVVAAGVQELGITCVKGETVCWGAWKQANEQYGWGAGSQCAQKCADCCRVCDGATEIIGLSDGSPPPAPPAPASPTPGQ